MNHSHPSSNGKRSSRLSSAARMRVAAGLAAIVGFGATAATMASCTADDGLKPRGFGNGTGGGSNGNASETTGGNADPNAPCISGTRRECHETVGTNDGILTCLFGERTCIGGSWGPCTGSFSGQMGWNGSSSPAVDPNDTHILNLSDAGPCQFNPCDPDCQDYEETPALDAGYKVVPVQTTVYYSADPTKALATIPGGFQTKGVADPCVLDNADGTPPAAGSGCEFDTHCVVNTPGVTPCIRTSTAANCCIPWKPGEYNKNCPKPDPTSAFACTLNGVPTIPVCNRGSVVLPFPTRVHIFPGNSSQFPVCATDNAPYPCDTTEVVQPGKCINLTGCPKLSGNGTVSYQVNPPKLANGNTTANPNWRDECRCENNWSVWAGDSTTCLNNYNYDAQPITKYQTYQAICPPGTRPQWQYLTWTTTTPADSTVVWSGHVADTSANLAAAPYVALGTAKATPTPDTHLCPMTGGPASCPINLYNAFGGSPAANSAFLELKILMNPTSDLTQGAGVTNWQVSYTCPPTM